MTNCYDVIGLRLKLLGNRYSLITSFDTYCENSAKQKQKRRTFHLRARHFTVCYLLNSGSVQANVLPSPKTNQLIRLRAVREDDGDNIPAVIIRMQSQRPRMQFSLQLQESTYTTSLVSGVYYRHSGETGMRVDIVAYVSVRVAYGRVLNC